MIWNSWNDFFLMGGYGLYVWGAVLGSVSVIGGELLALRWRRKGALTMLSAIKSASGKMTAEDER